MLPLFASLIGRLALAFVPLAGLESSSHDCCVSMIPFIHCGRGAARHFAILSRISAMCICRLSSRKTRPAATMARTTIETAALSVLLQHNFGALRRIA